MVAEARPIGSRFRQVGGCGPLVVAEAREIAAGLGRVGGCDLFGAGRAPRIATCVRASASATQLGRVGVGGVDEAICWGGEGTWCG
ncbi:hypothetical protein GCM10010286_48780 [Streptomyces toxytricini]|nr:hypothetical protein GCM10010286_48780 [Streptomyces toxytricini]